MLAKMGRPRLPGVLQRDIRNSKPLRPTRSSDRSASHGLLPGWKEAKAPDGRTYYFHAESGETKWDKPAAEESSAGERPKKPTAALVVRAKPVIPGVAGLAKLPRGWRMITGADGKAYYFNKKTNEVSWEPPPPVHEGEEGDAKDVAETLVDAKEALKEGWRRAKQVAAVKVFKATSTDDPELDSMYDQTLQVELQISSIKQTVEAYLASLVEMCWSALAAPPDLPASPRRSRLLSPPLTSHLLSPLTSSHLSPPLTSSHLLSPPLTLPPRSRSAEQLATKLGDYVSEPGAVGHGPAHQAAGVWKELQRGATRSLENQFSAKVLQPLVGYLGEIEGIKSLHDQRQKRLIDYDYYRRKVAPSHPRPLSLPPHGHTMVTHGRAALPCNPRVAGGGDAQGSAKGRRQAAA